MEERREVGGLLPSGETLNEQGHERTNGLNGSLFSFLSFFPSLPIYICVCAYVHWPISSGSVECVLILTSESCSIHITRS